MHASLYLLSLELPTPIDVCFVERGRMASRLDPLLLPNAATSELKYSRTAEQPKPLLKL
jgi:hypothetical protein